MTMDVVNSFSEIYLNEGYEFNSECEENLYAEVDEMKFKQVLYNLIKNAINYTGKNKKVFITLKNAGKKIRFEITDTGNGIPEDQLDKVWDRFYRLNEYKHRTVAGTGLGLSIVKSILKLHHADFGIISSEGNGCMVWFEVNKLRREID
jgi:signal transduction histidine kinase